MSGENRGPSSFQSGVWQCSLALYYSDDTKCSRDAPSDGAAFGEEPANCSTGTLESAVRNVPTLFQHKDAVSPAFSFLPDL